MLAKIYCILKNGKLTILFCVTVVPIFLTSDDNLPNLFDASIVEGNFIVMAEIALFKELIPWFNHVFITNSRVNHYNMSL